MTFASSLQPRGRAKRFYGSIRALPIEGQIGVAMVLVVVLASAIAPLLCKWGPTEIDSDHVLSAPSGLHWLGTDQRGMDVWARILYAPRVDLTIAVAATALAMAIGVPLGTLAGAYEDVGRMRSGFGQLIMRTMDVLQAVPVFVFALAVVAVLGSGSANVILALGFVNAPVFVRLVRSEMLIWRQRTFVEAAMLAGWSRTRTAFRHILPNAIAPSIAQASVVLGYSILLTAGLSFVGAGVRPPTPEWGGMIADGAGYLATGQWWTALFPGIAIGLCVLGFSLAGEGLRHVIADSGMRLRGSRGTYARSAEDARAELDLDVLEEVERVRG